MIILWSGVHLQELLYKTTGLFIWHLDCQYKAIDYRTYKGDLDSGCWSADLMILIYFLQWDMQKIMRINKPLQYLDVL